MGRGNWADRSWLLDPVKDSEAIGLPFKICKYCGGRVDPPRRAWCSDRCVFTWWLFSSWGYMRRFIWSRAGKKCEQCGKKLTLHKNKTGKGVAEIHHIIQVKDGGTDEPYNLICLCKECHNKSHGNGEN